MFMLALTSASVLQILSCLYTSNPQSYTTRRRLRKTLLSSNYRVKKSVRRLESARRFWIKPGRTNAWWFSFCNETLPEEWKANFRMCKQTFDVLCREVNPYISRKITRLRTPVPKQIAITLYYLSDGGRMKKTPANAFGVAPPCMVSVIVKRVTQAISTHLASTYVKVPSTEAEIKESAANFFP